MPSSSATPSTEQPQTFFPTPEPTPQPAQKTTSLREESPSTSSLTPTVEAEDNEPIVEQQQAAVPKTFPHLSNVTITPVVNAQKNQTQIVQPLKKRGPGRRKKIEEDVPEVPKVVKPKAPRKPRQKRVPMDSLLDNEPTDWQKILKRKSLEAELLAEEQERADDNYLDLTVATKGTIQLVEWMRFHRIYFAGGLHVRAKILDRSGQRHVTFVMNAGDETIASLPADTTDIESFKDREKKPEIIKKLLERQVLPPRRACQYTRFVVLQCTSTHWRLMDWYVIKSTGKEGVPEEGTPPPKPKRKYTRRATIAGTEPDKVTPNSPLTSIQLRKRKSVPPPIIDSDDSDDLFGFNYEQNVTVNPRPANPSKTTAVRGNKSKTAPNGWAGVMTPNIQRPVPLPPGPFSSRNKRPTPDATFNHFEFREPNQSIPLSQSSPVNNRNVSYLK